MNSGYQCNLIFNGIDQVSRVSFTDNSSKVSKNRRPRPWENIKFRCKCGLEHKRKCKSNVRALNNTSALRARQRNTKHHKSRRQDRRWHREMYRRRFFGVPRARRGTFETVTPKNERAMVIQYAVKEAAWPPCEMCFLSGAVPHRSAASRSLFISPQYFLPALQGFFRDPTVLRNVGRYIAYVSRITDNNGVERDISLLGFVTSSKVWLQFLHWIETRCEGVYCSYTRARLEKPRALIRSDRNAIR